MVAVILSVRLRRHRLSRDRATHSTSGSPTRSDIDDPSESKGVKGGGDPCIPLKVVRNKEEEEKILQLLGGNLPDIKSKIILSDFFLLKFIMLGIYVILYRNNCRFFLIYHFSSKLVSLYWYL